MAFFTKDNLADLITKGVATVGDHTYGAPAIRWWGEQATLSIGRYCSIAEGVTIFLGGNHREDWVTTYPFSALKNTWPEATGIDGHPATNGNVRIGNDVWIGDGASILSGVTIGNGAVIGARALVTKNVPSYTIVGGNSASLIRKRFSDEICDALEEISWWDWPEHRVRSEIPYLLSGDITGFIARNSTRTVRTTNPSGYIPTARQ
ncbi:MAG: CatB-related O-acetyltransferase [Rhizobiaceae bacterium]